MSISKTKQWAVLLLGAIFSGTSSVLSGVVLFAVILTGAHGAFDASVVYFSLGIIFQAVVAILIVLATGNAKEILNQFKAYPMRVHLYLMLSALAATILIMVIVLPSYAIYGTSTVSLMYLLIPIVAMLIFDTLGDKKLRTRGHIVAAAISLFGVYLLGITVGDQGTVLSVNDRVNMIGTLVIGLGLVAYTGAYLTKKAIKDAQTVIESNVDFGIAVVRIIWLMIIGLVGVAIMLATKSSTPAYFDILGSAIKERLLMVFCFIGLVQALGAFVNIIKAKAYGSYNKTLFETNLSFSLSALAVFLVTGLFVKFAPELLRDPNFKTELIPYKVFGSFLVLAGNIYYSRLKNLATRRVLFVCQGNVGRSQMAEGYYNSLTNTQNAFSAGVADVGHKYDYRPTDLIIQVMFEDGVDVSNQSIKQITPQMVEEADLIIVLCDEDICPSYLRESAKAEYRFITDPYGVAENETKLIRDEIKSVVASLI